MVSDWSVCLHVYVDVVYGTCMMGYVGCIGVVDIFGYDGKVDWICACNWVEVVEDDFLNYIIYDSCEHVVSHYTLDLIELKWSREINPSLSYLSLIMCVVWVCCITLSN